MVCVGQTNKQKKNVRKQKIKTHKKRNSSILNGQYKQPQPINDTLEFFLLYNLIERRKKSIDVIIEILALK